MATDDQSQVADDLTAPDVDASAQEPIQEQTEDTTTTDEQVVDSEVDSSEVKSQRGQQRVDELARERNAYAEEVRTLREQLQAQQPVQTDVLKQLEDYDLPLTGDYQTDMSLVEQRATEKAIANLEAKIQAKERLSTDIRELERAYPELRNDESNPKYDPDLTSEIVGLYRNASNNNPSLSLKSFVDGVMKVRAKGLSAGKEQSVTEIMSQEQSSVISPSSKSQVTNKSPNDMSLDELEQMVGYAG